MMRCICAGLLTIFVISRAVAGSNVQLNIPAQPIESAIRELARQSGVQVLYASDKIQPDLLVSAVDATSVESALNQMLLKTGLEYERLNARTLSIHPARQEQLRLAATDPTADVPGPSSSDSSKREVVNGGPPLTDSTAGLPQVLIKGARSLNADIERTRDDVRPYVVLDRKSIERSAAVSVDDLLKRQIPMNYAQVPGNSNSGAGALAGNSSQIALRGLVSTETLILVDGRRISGAKSGTQELQPDINSLPLSMIERVEVLPATASGIYGGGATGGVVNIVLRRDYTGVETSLLYENTLEGGGARKTASAFGGATFQDSKTSVQFGFSYSDLDSLRVGDRSYVFAWRDKYQTDQIAFNAANYYNGASPFLGSTTNISSARVGAIAPNLVLKTGQSLNSPITSVPAGYAGIASDGGTALIANAGKYNVGLSASSQRSGRYSDLLSGAAVGSGNVTIRTKITPHVDSFLDLSVGRNDLISNNSPISALFTIRASSAANPFNQDIVVNAPLTVTDSWVRTRVDSGRALVGLSARFDNNWTGELDYSLSKVISEQEGVPAQLRNTAGTAINDGSIDLFQDSAGYAEDLMAFTLPANSIDPIHSRLSDLSLRAAGPAFDTWAGRSTLSVLLEGREQYYSSYSSTSWQPTGIASIVRVSPGKQRVSSIYSELRLPLASEKEEIIGIRSAELQVAGRYDYYRMEASYNLATASAGIPTSTQSLYSVDPSLGLRIEPLRGLILRGSFGTGFLPPYLNQIQERQPGVGSLASFVDPKRGGEALGNAVTVYAVGNPDLQPEKSRNWSAGVVLSPTSIPNLRASVDWIRISKTDNITSIGFSQVTLNQEDLLPGFIIRAPATAVDPYGVGEIIAVDTRFRNGNRALSTSYDFSLDYRIPTSSLGEWGISIVGTKLVHNLQQIAVLAPAIEMAGTSTSPTWAGNATISWNLRNFTLTGSVRYLDSYWLSPDHSVVVNTLTDHLPSITYVDLSGEYRTGSERGDSVWSDLTIRGGVKNLLNTPPRYRPSAFFAEGISDPRMATYFLEVRKAFFN